MNNFDLPSNHSHRYKKSLSEQDLLYELKHAVNMVNQWQRMRSHYSNSSQGNLTKSLCHLEYILKLLEVMECGSIGGFAEKQPISNVEERIIWQVNRLEKA